MCLAYKPILSKLSKCQRLCSTPATLATDSLSADIPTTKAIKQATKRRLFQVPLKLPHMASNSPGAVAFILHSIIPLITIAVTVKLIVNACLLVKLKNLKFTYFKYISNVLSK